MSVVKKKIAGWVEMEYDREKTVAGIVWRRVKDGMGGKGDREDWVADVPGISVSVHDYQWKEPRFGFDRYDSFEEACVDQLEKAVKYTKQNIRRETRKLSRMKRGVALIQECLSTKETKR